MVHQNQWVTRFNALKVHSHSLFKKKHIERLCDFKLVTSGHIFFTMTSKFCCSKMLNVLAMQRIKKS